MSKRMSFSRTFPKGHPRAGEPTYFPQKILSSLNSMPNFPSSNIMIDWEALSKLGVEYVADTLYGYLGYKGHTCRPMFTASGKVACKAGDKYDFFSWEGTPYRSKQIVWARDVVLPRIVPLEIRSWDNIVVGNTYYYGDSVCVPLLEQLAANDGLTVADYKAWMECTKSVGVPLAIRIWDDNGLNY